MNRANRVADANVNMKTAGKDEKQALKVSAQDVLDGMHDKSSKPTRLVSQISTSGDAKFGGRNAPGTAGVVLTGPSKKSDPTAKPAEQQVSARPRQALPKGDNRPGNVGRLIIDLHHNNSRQHHSSKNLLNASRRLWH